LLLGAGLILAPLMLGTGTELRAQAAAPAGLPADLLDGAQSCEREGIRVLLRVQQVRNSEGNITALLFGDTPDMFLKKGARLDKKRVPAQAGETRLCLYAPQPGIYGVSLYHDENGNTDFDRNWTGLPTEGYGFSNNPSLFLGPPSFDQTAFEVGESGAVVEIDLKY
jgi:uncharacterized protein (DUF2141 family)